MLLQQLKVPLTLDIQLTLNNFENGATTISILVTSAQGSTHTNQFKLKIKLPEQKIYPDDLAASDNFGCAVSISGDFLIAGAQYDDDLGTKSGSAYIYKRTANGWQLMEKLQASDGAADDRFGYSVAISGDYAIVSAHNEDVSYDNSGAAYIFRRFGDNWYQEAKIYASDRSINDFFAVSVDIHDNYAIIGSFYEDHNYTDQGSTFLKEVALHGHKWPK
jgi:hypothetical protein